MTTVWHIMVRVWLASGSSRRQKMLEDIFPNLVCQALEGVDESAEHGEVSQQVLEIAKKKSEAIVQNIDFDLIIVSDTMLSDPDTDNVSIGKPTDEVDAAMMLHRLSGRRHRVWSSTGIYFSGHWKFFTDCAIVEIKQLSDEELVELVLSKSWEGKAGGYDLAGDMSKYAKLVDGDESTVLGIAGSAMELLNELANNS